MSEPVLEIDGLHVSYRVSGKAYTAVRDVSLQVEPGEILGVVGESGSGKSTLASSIIGLLPPGGSVSSGTIVVCGSDVSALEGEELRRLRGPGVAMIFQDPFTSLNPAFTIGHQLVIAQAAHDNAGSKRDHRRLAEDMLGEVGIPDPAAVMRAHPHELSGGQRQRTMIALALLLKPQLLIADEPTSALDVTTEAQILRLLRWLRDEHGTSILYVSHDLGSVAQLCDRVSIMYGGRIVENAPAASLFNEPAHPYTRALLDAVPSWRRQRERLATIPGSPPSLTESLPGCVYAPRCAQARDACCQGDPPLITVGSHTVRCLIPDAESAYHQQPQRSAHE